MTDNQKYKLIQKEEVEPHTGTSIPIKKNQVLRVTDIQGSQVVDLVSFSGGNPRQYLSSPRSMDYNNTIYFTSGDLLYSDQSQPMWTILDDTVGKHCFLFAPCDQKMYELTYDVTEPHPNCFENLSTSLSKFGIQPQQIFIPFNIFMHAEFRESGEIEIKPPLSKPGDFISLQAEMDMIVGISACSAYKANNYSFGPIRIEIFSMKGV
jgi:uncharacterized protein YcgI (DUF1989 family)